MSWALLVTTAARAESSQAGAEAGRPAIARAHLDFRITVLPALGAAAAPGALQARIGTGVVALTSGTLTRWQAQPARGSRVALAQRETELAAWAADGGRWTLAAP